MPTYQYACTTTECGNKFELVQSFTDPTASECPVCGGPVRKVFSAVGVVFKGSGFYRTDSRSANTASESASKSGESTKSEKASESSSSSNRTSSDSSGSSSGSSSISSSSGGSTSATTGKAAAPA